MADSESARTRTWAQASLSWFPSKIVQVATWWSGLAAPAAPGPRLAEGLAVLQHSGCCSGRAGQGGRMIILSYSESVARGPRLSLLLSLLSRDGAATAAAAGWGPGEILISFWCQWQLMARAN